MTRAQFALAVGATEKWVHNAAAALGRGVPYSPAAARRLAVARAIQAMTRVSLAVADRLAAAALALPVPESGSVAVLETNVGWVTLDLRRVLSGLRRAPRPGRRNTSPRRPGRHCSAAAAAIDRCPGRRARAYGIDLSLIDSNLRRTPEERLRTLDANAQFVSALARREVERPASTHPRDMSLLGMVAGLTRAGVPFVVVGGVAAHRTWFGAGNR